MTYMDGYFWPFIVANTFIVWLFHPFFTMIVIIWIFSLSLIEFFCLFVCNSLSLCLLIILRLKIWWFDRIAVCFYCTNQFVNIAIIRLILVCMYVCDAFLSLELLISCPKEKKSEWMSSNIILIYKF